MSVNASYLRGNINHYLLWNLSLFPIKKQKKILDLGCGPGLYFYEIMTYNPELYYAVDNSDQFLSEIDKLFEGRQNCKSHKLDLTLPGTADNLKGYKFDYVLCFDVLEHIDDERQFLNNVHSIMATCKSGYLFLRVPAIQAIYGENDKAIGHYRRYSVESIKKLLCDYSFKIEMIRYQNIIGIIPWYIIGNILKRPAAASVNEAKIFNHMVPAIKLIESVIPPPIGLSIACVCSL